MTDMKIGIMGGTFDPIHIGHLISAEEVREALNLDKVLFIPAGEPWMKADQSITEAEHRVEMVRLAIRSNPFFGISIIEIEHPGWSYTVDTLEQLSRDLGSDTSLFLLIGWDGLKTMPQWKAPYRISTMATLVTFPRPGASRPDITDLEESMPGLSKRLIEFEGTPVGISSTDVRERLVAGKSVRYLIPDNVENYIAEYSLYKSK
ncbi:MAG: nicotinate-nucleotide adenylyltransferase [Dehalococcoidia bacterium]|nr:nicotinate-nucleotide adenylyltransferase [Dehalococcoidia bacterium]